MRWNPTTGHTRNFTGYLLTSMWLVVPLLSGSAGCRTAGPKRPGGTETVHLENFGGYLEFLARQRDREQESKVGAGRSTSKETILEERLKMEVDGYVYHPNFLEFTLGGLFGLLQSEFDDTFGERRETSSDSGTVLEFDLNGHFFRKKAYPGSVFARRYQGIEPRPFLSSLRTTTTNLGLTWQYVDEKMPTNVQFSYTDVDIDPLGSTDEAGGQRKNTLFRFDTQYRFSDHNVLSFLYNRESVEERPFPLDFDTDEITLSHRLDFGDNHQYRLESELNYFDQAGTFNIERLRWREVLRLTHNEKLKSWYVFEAMERTQGSLAGVPPIDETSLYLSGTVEHELYDSLITQLFGFIQTQDFQQGAQIDRASAQLSFDYRKKNRWGKLLANYRVRLQTEDRTGADILGEVVDARHTFRDPEPIVLNELSINTGSIIITTEEKLTVLRPVRDYLVRRVGDQVEIERVPSGHILDGQTVLISYVFDIGGDFSLDTITHNFFLRQDFDFGLSPYYRLRWQDQTLSPAEATGAIAEDITGHVLGLEYRRGSLRLVAELEDYESNIRPFQAIRLTADYTHRFKTGTTGVFKARWSDYDYDPPNERETSFWTLEGRCRHPIMRNMSIEAAVLYRNEEDSLTGSEEGVDFDLSFEWLIRQTELRVTYEYGVLEDAFSDNQHSTLFVQVRRKF